MDKQLMRWSWAGYKRVLMFGKWWDIENQFPDRYTEISVDYYNKQVVVTQSSYN